MDEAVGGRGGALPAVVLLGCLLVLVPGTAHAQDAATEQPVRFEAGADTTFEVDDGRRFLDTLELRLAPDGSPVLVNELGIDDYVAGVEEVPARWHAEALKAQAVAARTYAWRSVRRGTFRDRGLGYDICGTVACQVFTGTRVVEESSHGQRWRAAVDETSGRVLLEDDGGPILARYFSTSGGRTLPNQLVFPDSGAFPYLEGVDDPDDEVSPYHRWEVELTRDELDDILSRGETLATAVPVDDIERRGDLLDPFAEVVVTGRDGAQVTVGASELREFVSRIAPERHPDRFPSRRSDGLRRLPATLPSSRFTVEVTDDGVTFAGRGWGHGVGMSQHGARGMAMRDMDHEEILAHYYGGLTPQTSDDLVERLRVGLDVADDVEVHADGPFRVVAGDEVLAERAMGPWRVAVDGGSLRVAAPDSHGAPLEVSATRLVEGPPASESRAVVEAEVGKPAELRLVVTDGTDRTVLDRDLGVRGAGTHTATWGLRDDEDERVPAGEYQVALVAVDELEDRAGEAVEVTVRSVEDGAGTGGGGSGILPLSDGRGPLLVGAALLVLLAVGGAATAMLAGRRA